MEFEQSRPIGRLRLKRRRAFIESYTFPPALAHKLGQQFESERAVTLALEGLRSWYLACLYANGQMLGMPSRAVDVAWHEMILMTREYHAFCYRAFGHYLHHSPEAVVPVPMDDILARTLDVVETHSLAVPAAETFAGVPLLFAVDGAGGIENGFVWEADDLARMRDRRAAGYYGDGRSASRRRRARFPYGGGSEGCAGSSGCAGDGGGDGGGCGGGCGGG
jgi:hypothetical protein